jgi:RNA polymerase sigma-70 factor (ECF subfamily)
VSAYVSDTEPGLIQLAAQGDAAACAALYERHYEAVYRYCYYHVGDVALAQDVTSEVFVRMVQRLDAFDARGRPFVAWLYAIARNLIADTFRRTKRFIQLPLDENLTAAEDAPSRSAERHLLAECLVAALAHLTEEQRQVILFRFVEGHSNTEVARLMEKSEGAIKSLQFRALAALRRALEKERCYEP